MAEVDFDYIDRDYKQERTLREINMIRSHGLESKHRLLDIGSGDGLYSKMLKSMGYNHIFNLDINDFDNYQNLVRANWDYMPFRNKSFDFVSALGFFIYEEKCKEISRVIKDNGIFVASVVRWDRIKEVYPKRSYTNIDFIGRATGKRITGTIEYTRDDELHQIKSVEKLAFEGEKQKPKQQPVQQYYSREEEKDMLSRVGLIREKEINSDHSTYIIARKS